MTMKPARISEKVMHRSEILQRSAARWSILIGGDG